MIINPNENVVVMAGNDAPRVMPNSLQTKEYVSKLSHASIVRVYFLDGSWAEFECGSIINSGVGK